MAFQSPIATSNKILHLVDVNSANADVAAITGLPGKWRFIRMFSYDATVSLTTATLGVYTAAAAGGTAIVSPVALSAQTDGSKITNLASTTTDIQTASTLYVRNVAAQGAPATISICFEYTDCG